MEHRDAVEAAPEVYEVVLENDRVRVLEVTGVPGVVSPMHGHPDSVVYAVDAAEILVTDAAGESNSGLRTSLSTHWQKLILKAEDQKTGPGKHQGHE